MTTMHRLAALGTLLLLGAAACADLDVTNPNAPDRERTLVTAGDIEALISSGFKHWHDMGGSIDDAGDIQGTAAHFLSTVSFQHSAWPANFGMVFYSGIPRPGVVNDQTHAFYGFMAWPWFRAYKALSAVGDGLRSIDADPDVAAELGTDRVLRARAYTKFVQGLAHSSLALYYSGGFIVDETTDVRDETGNFIPQPAVTYTQMLNAGFGYLDDAIALARTGTFAIPATWMSVPVDQDELIGIAYFMKARYRAAVSRTPAERAMVDWNAVLADIDSARVYIPNGWEMELPFFDNDIGGFSVDLIDYNAFAAWQQLTYFILGMADTSGNYQRWLSFPVVERTPDVGGSPILIHSPDQRFVSGATVAEQKAACVREALPPASPRRQCPGTGIIYAVPYFALGNSWGRPDRGTWRWSYYWSVEGYNFLFDAARMWPEISVPEMDLLEAEARIVTGGDVIGLIDNTRVPAGLGSAVANTSCVPKLPNGTCGGLMEMLKWEKRIETQFRGLHATPWYFDGRGWGDLYRNTYLQFPIPCVDADLLDLPCETFGGGGPMSSLGSVYAWPFE